MATDLVIAKCCSYTKYKYILYANNKLFYIFIVFILSIILKNILSYRYSVCPHHNIRTKRYVVPL